MDSKPLPSDPKTEGVLLGTLLLGSQQAMMDAAELLKSEYFAEHRNAVIFDSMLALYDRAQGIDLITLTAEMRKAGTIKAAGGTARVTELASWGASPGAVTGYAQILREVYRRRCLAIMAATLHQEAHNETTPTEAILSRLDGESLRLAAMDGHRGFYHVTETLRELYIQREAESKGRKGLALKTGMADLDAVSGGLAEGELIIIAARPSIGKTALAQCAAVNITRNGGTVGMFSLEMARIALANRFMAIAFGNAEPTFSDILEAQETMESYGLWIDDTHGQTMRVIGAKSRKLKIKNKIDLIIIDYLGLIQSSDRSENRNEEVRKISLALKNLARELGIPVVCLAQLNRECESRPDKRPQLSDLRDSGSIEQDADQVWLLHRPEHYGQQFLDAKESAFNPKQEPLKDFWKGRAEVIIAKNRNGRTGSAYLEFVPELTRFQSMPTVTDDESEY